MLVQGNIQRLPLPDNSIDMIFTDPPYAREYLPCYGWLATEAMRTLKPGGFVLAMCGGSYLNQIYRMFDAAGLRFVWENREDKPNYNPGVVWLAGGNSVMSTSKAIITYSKGIPRKAQRFVDVYSQRTMPDKRFHEWGQDVGSASYYISKFSETRDLILDPFIGGGTTAAACKLLDRRCIGLDIDPAALRITADRMSGKHAPTRYPLFEGER